jgi:hypothetical protein
MIHKFAARYNPNSEVNIKRNNILAITKRLLSIESRAQSNIQK